jgi:hypothetical protein
MPRAEVDRRRISGARSFMTDRANHGQGWGGGIELGDSTFVSKPGVLHLSARCRPWQENSR